MIAVDTNILVYAHRHDLPEHARAAVALRSLSEGRASWAIPWPCLHEFLSTATHPRVFSPPTPQAAALGFVDRLLQSPSLCLLAETAGYRERFTSLIVAGNINGPRVHDARIAALCLVHGVSELLTADRDFGRFPELSVRNPLVG